jgi:thiamine pyrophosphokinase
MNKIGIIVSGGSINDEFATNVIKSINPSVLIGVDSGLGFLYRNQISPTHIVGDFDSVDANVIAYYKEQTNIPFREFNPVKDATDTEIALRLAIELGVTRLYVLGATGTRLDHVMSNIQILKIALDAGVETYLWDSCNRISLWNTEICLKRETSFGTYFSIFPFGGTVEKVFIKGAKYPLSDYQMTPYESRTVSNEFSDDIVQITFENGYVILMETRDRKENNHEKI